MTDTAAFWDRIAPKYAKDPIKNMDAYEQSLERVRSHLSERDHVLELGCGTGATALLLSPNVAHVTATDISPGMIAQAEARLKGGENVTFKTATAETLQGLQGAADVVTAFNLMHLVADLDVFLAQAANLVKPGGLFISKTPCLRQFNPLVRVLIPAMQLVGKAPATVSYFTTEQLENAIAKAGFEIIETGSYPVKPPSRFVVAKRL
ncbi:MAG: class I SAM-dependent methyltransferase [Litoreibacter sp.]|nr:class I SAM-dependent methyltransferase [Litoreibacter sp.]